MNTQRIKKLRIEIDYILKLSRLLWKANVIRNLKLAKMWLGKVLGEFKQKGTPYPHSTNPNNQIIEPEADCYNGPVSFGDYNEISAIKELRRLIEVILPEFRELEDGMTGRAYCYFKEAEMRLTEAKLWLGVELGVIRDKMNNQKEMNSQPMCDINAVTINSFKIREKDETNAPGQIKGKVE